MKELNELINDINDINEQSVELLEHMENDLEIEIVRQELTTFRQQQSQVNKIMLLGVTMTALFSILIVLKIIMTTIQ